MLNSIRKGLGKAIISKGFYGGTKRYFGIGIPHSYGASVGRWKRLGAPMDGIKHHWAISQKLMEQHTWLKPIGNQTWNLKKFGSHAKHMRWGHGQTYFRKRYSYWRFAYPAMATPTWFKAGTVSGGLRGLENYNRND